ncbi:MAG: L-threonylcarbamoyladenylate synthase [Halioglobus sp.]
MSSLPAFQISGAVASLRRGGVIAYPTEAVWGLGCDPADEAAVNRLLALKRREVGKGLILVASNVAQLDWLLSGLDEQHRLRLDESWPGPNTWLVPHHGRVPQWIHGDHDTVAVRVSAHHVVRNLCNSWGGVLVSTSANRAGCVAATQRFQVLRYFGGQLDYIVPGSVGSEKKPSLIRNVVSNQVIRS